MWVVGFKIPFQMMGQTHWFNHSAFCIRPRAIGQPILIASREEPSKVYEATVHHFNPTQRPAEDFKYFEVME